jgi:hypothetical protein
MAGRSPGGRWPLVGVPSRRTTHSPSVYTVSTHHHPQRGCVVRRGCPGIRRTTRRLKRSLTTTGLLGLSAPGTPWPTTCQEPVWIGAVGCGPSRSCGRRARARQPAVHSVHCLCLLSCSRSHRSGGHRVSVYPSCPSHPHSTTDQPNPTNPTPSLCVPPERCPHA